MSLPNHLFVSSTDGALYDTRIEDWYEKAPLRAVYSRCFETIEDVAQLKATLRSGEFTSFGGYPLYFVTSDGAALSFDSVEDNLASVLWSVSNEVDDGWRVVGCSVNYEDTQLRCEHSGEPIGSAYGEPEDLDGRDQAHADHMSDLCEGLYDVMQHEK